MSTVTTSTMSDTSMDILTVTLNMGKEKRSVCGSRECLREREGDYVICIF